MAIPHFYKARSRMGILNPPIGSKKLNIGVEDAPDAILDSKFLQSLRNYDVNEYTFSDPNKVNHLNFFDILAGELAGFKKLIDSTLKKKERSIVVGGDDSVTFSSLLVTIDRYGDDFGYIRFDSHGDMNLYQTSPTKNFHGMYHRALFNGFDIPQISSLVKTKMNPENALFIANLILDPEEDEFFRKSEFRNINKKDLSGSGIVDIEKFVTRFRQIHVSFDIDCLDESIAPATGIPAKDGLFPDEVNSVLKILDRNKIFAFDLVEVNPKKRGAQKTVAISHTLLETILI